MIHKMKLNDGPFQLIKSRKKTIELRLYDEKRSLLKEGDFIEFTNVDTLDKITVKIIKLHRFDSFSELYKHFDKEKMGYLPEENASSDDMFKYYSLKEQNKYGVVGIEIEMV